jgi:hypothetical protein
VDRDSFRDLDSLHHFIATRGNSLQLTDPRPIKVDDPRQSLEELFEELVGGPASASSKSRSLFPELRDLFVRLKEEGRASIDYHYRLPVFEQDFKVPFAYRNGTLNLVKPQKFLERVPQTVLELATRGNLIRKHGLPDEPHSRLIVVPRFESTCAPEFVSHVDRLLTDFDVTHVPEQKLDHFITLVDSEAHG